MEYIVENANGVRLKLMSLGATLAELHVPDSRGEMADVVLGFDDEEGYRSDANQHFGCTTGRYANRIARGKFAIDGAEYQLAINNGENHLHGGSERSLDKVEWRGERFESSDGAGVRFHYVSPDGEEGYPGELKLTVSYKLTVGNAVQIHYKATTDKPTPVNLTNHSYFNLGGHGAETALDHQLQIDAPQYTPKDASGIPTGEIADVAGTPLDFRTQQRIGDRIGDFTGHEADGYDHNLVLDCTVGAVRLFARLSDPASGRVMRAYTDQPAVQLYTANFVWGQTCKAERVYRRHSAVCLETQHFPDSPNKPQFPSTILRPGETYRHECVYEFDVE